METKENWISFFVDDEKWVMKIVRNDNGCQVLFNTEEYPNCLPDDFAKAIAHVLCQSGWLDEYYKNHSKDCIE